jgi:membrane-associated phospholipid phosphatase
MWLHHIKSALCSHILFKCIGITLFISLFFVVYFHVLNYPAYPTTVIPLTYLDKLISFQPLALPIYLSLWLYVAIPPALITNREELYAFTLSIALMSIVGLTIFYFWPTTIPVSGIDWRLHPSIGFLKSVDAAGNACPSMHVATAFFSGAWTDYLLRKIKTPIWLRFINLMWGIGIIYSTIATRQHVALDVVGGLVLAGIAILLARSTFWKKC